MRIVNLTPHAINLIVNSRKAVQCQNTGEEIFEEAETLTTLPSEGVARVSTNRRAIWPAALTGSGIRVTAQTFGAVEGLPEPQEGVVYVVSAMVLTALNNSRPDVFAPDTGPDAVRENGQIVAVRGLVQ